MNTKELKLISFLFIIVFLSVGSTSYGWNCVDAHPTINEMAGKLFIAKSQTESFGEKYKNSPIDTKIILEGYTFKKAKMTEKSSKPYLLKTNFTGWLARGGHDADVPSFQMGFRHFYDPIYDPHYLTWFRRWLKKPDKKDYASEAEFFKSLQYRADDWNPNIKFGTKDRKFSIQPKVIKPEIDAITWALKHEENEHSWHAGLIAYKAAMENDSSKFGKLNREQVYAKAFRCLGETMHLMADMAQPAHVRADSHSVHEPIEKTVDGEMIKKVIGDKYLNPDFKPTRDFTIVRGLSPEVQMQRVAVFTNKRFFSNDTIFDYKKWVFQRNHKKAYPEPQLSRLKEVKGVYYSYFKDVGWVQLARETGSLFSMVIGKSEKYGRKNPKFNVLPSMAEDQAKVLIPLAIYNCSELIDKFFPTMQLDADYSNKDGNTFSFNANLIHNVEQDSEWKEIGEIKYSGTGFVYVNNNLRQKCNFVSGATEFESNLESGDTVRICIRAGGRMFWSKPIEIR